MGQYDEDKEKFRGEIGIRQYPAINARDIKGRPTSLGTFFLENLHEVYPDFWFFAQVKPRDDKDHEWWKSSWNDGSAYSVRRFLCSDMEFVKRR